MLYTETDTIDLVRIEESIEMIEKYITDGSAATLVSFLGQFNHDSDNEVFLSQLRATLNAMGPVQGAVLTYAPYLALLLSENLFPEEEDEVDVTLIQ